MLLKLQRTLALYCPICDGVEHHHFSLFELNDSYPLSCRCGFPQGQIQRRSSRFEVRLFTLAGDKIRLLYTLKDFAKAPLLTLSAPVDGEEFGFLGDGRQVEQAVADWGEFLDDDPEFLQPDLMYQILGRLKQLASEKKICCRCQQPAIGMDVHPDRVELVCVCCGSYLVLRAVEQADVDCVERFNEINLEKTSYLP